MWISTAVWCLTCKSKCWLRLMSWIARLSTVLDGNISQPKHNLYDGNQTSVSLNTLLYTHPKCSLNEKNKSNMVHGQTDSTSSSLRTLDGSERRRATSIDVSEISDFAQERSIPTSNLCKWKYTVRLLPSVWIPNVLPGNLQICFATDLLWNLVVEAINDENLII